MKTKDIFLAALIAHLVFAARAIFYGRQVKIQQIPYIVLLKNDNFFCSGALISTKHVLTAAHCIGEGQSVLVGTDHYDENLELNPFTKVFKVNKTWTHENFSLPSAVYDIGVIELPEPVGCSEAVRTIRISKQDRVEDDQDDLEVVTAGFGYSENYVGETPYLQYSRLELISLDDCQKYKSHYIEDLNENHICMTSIKGQPCDGDSGAPVISVKTRQLLGILSYIKDAENGESIYYNDCLSATPSVATRVAPYIDWISEKTGLSFD